MSDCSEIDSLTLSGQFTPTMHRAVYPSISPKNPSNSAGGKGVLITGATHGIWKVIALPWAEAGAASIVITGRNQEGLAQVAGEVKKLSPRTKVAAFISEAASEADAKQLWTRVKAEVGLIDEINICGPYLQIYNFLQQHISSGKEPTGTIIIMSSATASFNQPGMSAYAISKLVEIRLAEFLQHSGLRTFAVHPGLVPTDMIVDAFSAQTVDPPELSDGLSLYLSTARADFLRGKYLSVNWDVDEMEARASEINEKKLLNTAFLHASLGLQGHPFEVKV